MITKRERGLSNIMVGVQVALTLMLFLLTAYFFPGNKYYIGNTIALMIQITLVWTFFFKKLNLGVIFRANTLSSLLHGYMVTVVFGGLLLFLEVLIISYFRPIVYSLRYIELFVALDLLGLISFKLIFHHIMLYLRRNGYNSRNVIIIADTSSEGFIHSFIKANDWGYNVMSIVSPDAMMVDTFDNIYIIESHDRLRDFIQTNPIDDIFYCLPVIENHYNLEQLIAEMDEIGVSLHIMQHPDIQIKKSIIANRHLFKHSFVTHQTVSDKYVYLKIKVFVDILFSVIILILVSPLMLLIAFLIKLEDGGPVFFKQERIGQNGRRFKCMKFRTMIPNAEQLLDKLASKNEADGPVFKIVNDPRITKIGRFLRKTSLDELPQFFNVIRGEMSVVGPRPPLLKEVKQYERSQLRRLSMKPGITCSWQVWGRHEVTFDEWMQMDLDYIDNWSPMLDLKIVLATVGVIFAAKGQ